METEGRGTWEKNGAPLGLLVRPVGASIALAQIVGEPIEGCPPGTVLGGLL